MDKHTVADIDVAGKRVLVRVDFNVPLEDGGSSTIAHPGGAADDPVPAGAGRVGRPVSHLGRPDGKVIAKYSLCPVRVERLGQLMGKTRARSPGDAARRSGTEDAVKRLRNGEVLLLENLRFHAEEEKNDPKFARQLAASATST